MSKLTEIDKLKFWVDAELTFIHILCAIILFQLVTATWQRVGLVVYMIWALLYVAIRVTYVLNIDKNYLRIPKK